MKISKTLADDAILAEIGERVTRRRLDLQLTQADVAEQAGVAKRTLERIEAGASAGSVAGSGSHDPRGRGETNGFTEAQGQGAATGLKTPSARSIKPIR